MGVEFGSAGVVGGVGPNTSGQFPESNRIYPLDRMWVVQSSITLTSGLLHVVPWRQAYTKNVNRIDTQTRGTAAGATPTTCLMGLYEFTIDWSAETYTATRLALSSNDTALWAGTFTGYEKAFSSSETITLRAGGYYGAACLCVTGATAPIMYGAAFGAGFTSKFFPTAFTISGQTTIPTSFTQATSGLTAGAGAAPYFGLRLV